MNDQSQETAKAVLDGLSVATVIGTLMDILPAVAALFTIIWTGIRIWETDTVRRMLDRKEPDDAE
jgi:hypothetical protein